MRQVLRTVLAVAVAVLAGWTAERADAARRTRSASSKLVGDALYRAKGRIAIRRQEPTRKLPEREICALSFSRLDSADTYTLWLDSPSDASELPVRIAPNSVVPRRDRTAVIRFDSTASGLPFGASLSDLALRRFQLRNGAGEIVLAGSVPALRAPR